MINDRFTPYILATSENGRKITDLKKNVTERATYLQHFTLFFCRNKGYVFSMNGISGCLMKGK